MKAGLFHIVTGSYDIPAAHVVTDGYYTNKAPGGVAYRCSFRVTEASYLIERLVDNAAHELGVDAAQFRLDNFIQPDSSRTSLRRASSTTRATTRRRCGSRSRSSATRSCAPSRRPPAPKGGCSGSGSPRSPRSGAGKGKDYDIAGLRMFDSAELRIHPTGKAILKLGVRTQGQGHETTFAQIVASELGIPYDHIEVQEGDTDNTPWARHVREPLDPRRRAATAVIARKLRDKGKEIAAHLLEASARTSSSRRALLREGVARPGEDDPGHRVRRVQRHSRWHGGRARGRPLLRPPNMTYPFGTYAVVVEIDRGTGQWKVEKVVAVDDCGVRINPMIVEGQIMGGLTEGYAIAAMELITFDDDGNCIGRT